MPLQVCALVALVALEAVARGPAHTELFGGFVGEEGPMLAGWGSRLPGVANLARAHVHEYGAHKFHDGDGLWQSGLFSLSYYSRSVLAKVAYASVPAAEYKPFGV